MPCGGIPVSDMQSWSDYQTMYIVVFGSTSPKTLLWLNNACADCHCHSESLKAYNLILVFRDCFVQYVAVFRAETVIIENIFLQFLLENYWCIFLLIQTT